MNLKRKKLLIIIMLFFVYLIRILKSLTYVDIWGMINDALCVLTIYLGAREPNNLENDYLKRYVKYSN